MLLIVQHFHSTKRLHHVECCINRAVLFVAQTFPVVRAVRIKVVASVGCPVDRAIEKAVALLVSLNKVAGLPDSIRCSL